MSDTPRTDAVKQYLNLKYPDPLNDHNKLIYYMEAAESFGQECVDLEREVAALREATIEKCATYVDNQHCVWDGTDISAFMLLKQLAKNIRALKGKP